jgi:hypothetical protein
MAGRRRPVQVGDLLYHLGFDLCLYSTRQVVECGTVATSQGCPLISV